MFEELSHIILQKFPSLNIEGDIYPPPAWRSHLAKLVQLIKFALIIITVSGIDPFPSLGFHTPSIITYALQNKMSFCLMAFLVGNLVEGQLLSTGAFEIYFDDMPIWSKLDSHRIPQPQELLQIIDNHMGFTSLPPQFGPSSHASSPPPL